MLGKGGLALNDMHEPCRASNRLRASSSRSSGRCTPSFGSHRDHAIETIDAHGKRIGETRRDVSERVERFEALKGAAG